MWLTVVMGNECEHICHSNFIGSYCKRFCWLKWPQIQKCIKASLKKKKKVTSLLVELLISNKMVAHHRNWSINCLTGVGILYLWLTFESLMVNAHEHANTDVHRQYMNRLDHHCKNDRRALLFIQKLFNHTCLKWQVCWGKVITESVEKWKQHQRMLLLSTATDSTWKRGNVKIKRD